MRENCFLFYAIKLIIFSIGYISPNTMALTAQNIHLERNVVRLFSDHRIAFAENMALALSYYAEEDRRNLLGTEIWAQFGQYVICLGHISSGNTRTPVDLIKARTADNKGFWFSDRSKNNWGFNFDQWKDLFAKNVCEKIYFVKDDQKKYNVLFHENIKNSPFSPLFAQTFGNYERKFLTDSIAKQAFHTYNGVDIDDVFTTGKVQFITWGTCDIWLEFQDNDNVCRPCYRIAQHSSAPKLQKHYYALSRDAIRETTEEYNSEKLLVDLLECKEQNVRIITTSIDYSANLFKIYDVHKVSEVSHILFRDPQGSKRYPQLREKNNMEDVQQYQPMPIVTQPATQSIPLAPIVIQPAPSAPAPSGPVPSAPPSPYTFVVQSDVRRAFFMAKKLPILEEIAAKLDALHVAHWNVCDSAVWLETPIGIYKIGTYETRDSGEASVMAMDINDMLTAKSSAPVHRVEVFLALERIMGFVPQIYVTTLSTDARFALRYTMALATCAPTNIISASPAAMCTSSSASNPMVNISGPNLAAREITLDTVRVKGPGDIEPNNAAVQFSKVPDHPVMNVDQEPSKQWEILDV